MRHWIFVPLAAAIVVTGCNKAAEVKPQTGRWEFSAKLLSFDIPGVPDAMKAGMDRKMASEAETFASCLTPEQAQKPGISFFFAEAPRDCTYDSFSMAGGKLDAVASCKEGAGSMTKATLAGTYGADTIDAKITVSGEMMPNMPARLEISTTGKRTGDCNGTETVQAPRP